MHSLVIDFILKLNYSLTQYVVEIRVNPGEQTDPQRVLNVTSLE